MSLMNKYFAEETWGKNYKPYPFRKTISLNINHYLYLNLIKGNKTLSSLLRKLIVENRIGLLTEAITRDVKLFDCVYSTPKRKTVRVSIGFANKRELNRLTKNQTLSEYVNKKLNIIYEAQRALGAKMEKELNN